jgi:triacylglycerol lipase
LAADNVAVAVTPGLPALPPAIVGAFGGRWWNEGRAPLERLQLARTGVPLAPRRGRRVVLVTGYLDGGTGSRPLVDWLRGAGYRVDVAKMRGNIGASSTGVERIEHTLRSADDGPAILIGHSRGGQLARVAAFRNPELVDQLITLGAPVRAHLPRNAALRTSVEALRLIYLLPIGPNLDPKANTRYEQDLFTPFDVDVPWTSIWSKIDGVVEWQTCLDERAQSIEVPTSHTGLIASVASFRAIASVLDQMSVVATTS